MSEHAGQDNGTPTIPIREAANRLRVTESAIWKRMQRSSVDKELGSCGRVYVSFNLPQEISYPESQVYHNLPVEKLGEELQDRVAFLKGGPERRSVEAEWYQRIVAGLMQTNNQLTTQLRELEPPPAEPATPEKLSQTPESAAEPVRRGGAAGSDSEVSEGCTELPWGGRLSGG
jgi:DNA-binding Lrp family transcriptional regulator